MNDTHIFTVHHKQYHDCGQEIETVYTLKQDEEIHLDLSHYPGSRKLVEVLPQTKLQLTAFIEHQETSGIVNNHFEVTCSKCGELLFSALALYASASQQEPEA